ncbi:MAG: glycine cleavage system aminomethyltransferase GcvT [Candidatus Aminicenantes bacterium]|nr:glycine cleavage system aminomethyltransferase GcvT [Candidatus Aminicenantes bacterium]
MSQTRLHSSHLKHNGKMIDFFGWDMPVEFSGIIHEHMAVRERAGLFDVSHMGEIRIKGPRALDFVQFLTPNNAARLGPGKAQYSALTTPKGTFVDDLLVYYQEEDEYLLVVNAANTAKDFEWILSHAAAFDVTVTDVSEEYTQIAVQGPEAQGILSRLTDVALEEMKSFHFAMGRVAGVESLVSRTGYTGEDGFEIYTRDPKPDLIWEALLDEGKSVDCLPIGLGARDTLRLESCLMLYGNDIDDTTTVLEAGLSWLIKFKKGEFLGRSVLLKQNEEGVTRRITGFEIVGRGIARSHYPVFVEGEKVSEVTSGTYSPYLKKSIGLAYLPIGSTLEGTELQIEIRGKRTDAVVVPIPFYKRES